jgi:hypothetical protein
MKYVSRRMYDSFRKGLNDSMNKDKEEASTKDSISEMINSLGIRDTSPRYPGAVFMKAENSSDNPIEEAFKLLGVK